MSSKRGQPGELTNDLRRRMRAYYERSSAYLEDLEGHDAHYLENYVRFVCDHVAVGATLLDLGCGTGLSTRLLTERGYRAVGVDFSTLFLRRGRAGAPGLPLVCADVTELPFADGVLDAVAGTNFVEHLTDVPAFLAEAWRVLAPGGRLLLLGPNLCSPFFPLSDLVGLLTGRGGRPVFAESVGPAWRWLRDNAGTTWRKCRAREPQWLYREPDLSERHVGGDSDSTYLACPIDFERYFDRIADARIVQLSTGTSRKSRLLARACPRWSPFLGLVVERKRSSSGPRN